MEIDAKIPQAGKRRGLTRFLQFRLRSLFLFTFVVACWLGWEVHCARTVERQAAVIRALGDSARGEVVYETARWSLLRFFEPETYGRRIVAAQLNCDCLDDAIGTLKSMSHLRKVNVFVTGTSDMRLDWSRSELPRATVETNSAFFLAFSGGSIEAKDWASSPSQLCCQRFARKMREFPAAPPMLVQSLDDLSAGNLHGWNECPSYEYRVLDDGSVAEWLVVRSETSIGKKTTSRVSNGKYAVGVEMMPKYSPGACDSVILLVNDRCVDARWFYRQPFLLTTDAVDEKEFGAVDVHAARLTFVATSTTDWKDEYRVEIRRDKNDGGVWFIDAEKLRSIRIDYAIEPTGLRCLQANDPFKN